MAESLDPYREWLGLSSSQRPPNHYQLLGLPEFESDEEWIEQAAMGQMSKVLWHEAGPHADLAARLMAELEAAQDCLLNPKRKAKYDQSLREYDRALREAEAATPFSDDDVGCDVDERSASSAGEIGFDVQHGSGSSDEVMGLALPPRSEEPKPPLQPPAKPTPASSRPAAARVPAPSSGDPTPGAAARADEPGPGAVSPDEATASSRTTATGPNRRRRKKKGEEEDSSKRLLWIGLGGGAVVLLIVVLAIWLAADYGGTPSPVRGAVYVQNPDTQLSDPIGGVTVTFIPADGGEKFTVETDALGNFSVEAEVAPGNYKVVIAVPDDVKVHSNYADAKKTPWSVKLPRKSLILLDAKPEGT